MYTCSISRLNNDVASSTLIYFSGTAAQWIMEDFLAGFQYRFHKLVRHCFLSASSFFHLAFCGLRFSFFCLCVVCVCPWICCHNFSSYVLVLPAEPVTAGNTSVFAGYVLPDLSQLSFYTFDLFKFKLWTISSPCFKASPLDWKSVESVPFDSFKSLNMTFNFPTIPLCFLIDQFSLLRSLGFNWYPGMENSLALSEQPSTLRNDHNCIH